VHIIPILLLIDRYPATALARGQRFADPGRWTAWAIDPRGTAMDDSQTPSKGKLVSELLYEDPDLHDVVEEFVAGLSGRIAELRRAYKRLDWEQLRTLAHRLKGAGGSYGYPDLSRLAARMEQDFMAHQADTFDACMRKLEELIAAAHAGLQGH
jgi:HPt (histidine-containing phosphotransfer) domain-containing protein